MERKHTAYTEMCTPKIVFLGTSIHVLDWTIFTFHVELYRRSSFSGVCLLINRTMSQSQTCIKSNLQHLTLSHASTHEDSVVTPQLTASCVTSRHRRKIWQLRSKEAHTIVNKSNAALKWVFHWCGKIKSMRSIVRWSENKLCDGELKLFTGLTNEENFLLSHHNSRRYSNWNWRPLSTRLGGQFRSMFVFLMHLLKLRATFVPAAHWRFLKMLWCEFFNLSNFSQWFSTWQHH